MKLGTETPQAHGTDFPGGGQCQLLLDRIAASRTFHRSPRLREVLLDIGEKTLAGRTRELSEQLIGVRVFGRDATYNPAEDTIVRSSARQLRQKLAEYFATEGRDETLVMEIPKGGYVAAFLPRPAIEDNAPPPVQTSITEPGFDRGASWLRVAAAGLAAIALLGTGVWIGRHDSNVQAASEPDTLFSRLFQEHPGPTRFVVTDSVVAILGVIQSAPKLEKYIDGSYLEDASRNLPGDAAQRLAHGLESRQITSYADVTILSKLFRTHPSWASGIEVRHAKHMRTGDFKSGNFIITGNFRSNPWSRLFDASTRFAIEGGQIHNLAPRAGEPVVWPEHASNSISMARISVSNNLDATGFVLHIAGESMEATQGAGEFLLRSGSLNEIREALGLRPGERIPPFEMVVQIGYLQGTATSAKILAAHRFL
jgi:hypothetical protein